LEAEDLEVTIIASQLIGRILEAAKESNNGN
jgi:hypothetical protein